MRLWRLTLAFACQLLSTRSTKTTQQAKSICSSFHRQWMRSPGRWLERDGKRLQSHILTFLGESWCRGDRPQWPDEKVIDLTHRITEKGGVVTYDVPIQENVD